MKNTFNTTLKSQIAGRAPTDKDDIYDTENDADNDIEYHDDDDVDIKIDEKLEGYAHDFDRVNLKTRT